VHAADALFSKRPLILLF